MEILRYAGKKQGVAVKTADRTFLKGQSVDLFRAAIKSQATRDPYERWLIGFLKKIDAASPGTFVTFAKDNLLIQWKFK